MAADSKTIELDDARRAKLVDALIRTGRGDRTAFETLYKTTSAKLFGVCLRIFPDRIDAEEALQDAYLTIWNKASSFEAGRASPVSWLVTVTRNRAIDRLRLRSRTGFTSLDQASEIVDPVPLADAQLLAASEQASLAGCIDDLEQRDAHFIRSAFMGGATYADLAKREGQPLGTVKSRIRRALIRLRLCLEGQDMGDMS
ncbi:MAG: sigma-70 family RNA polymerase sigma factor [Sphingorhabdus sp.]